jgi:REP element-mobilizing transposase RayT
MELIPFNPWEPLHVTSGSLPHWQQGRRTYFITWRTADSILLAWLRKLHHDRDTWLQAHDLRRKDFASLLPEKQQEFHQRFTHAWHDKLDECLGECVLRRQACRDKVASSLKHFDGVRYMLGDFVVMPNHVHLLVTPLGGEDVEKLCFSWKRFSSGEINKVLGKKGEFWQVESYDHIVRSGEALRAIQKYIANNSLKAGLREGKFTLYQPESWR